MLARLRAHLTYANVMASIAVFILLGGVAWAAAKIDSGDVKDNSLKSEDLKDGKGVKSADVKEDSLTGDDIDEPTLSGVLKGTVVRRTEAPYANLNAGDNVGGTVGCGSGEVAVGGGGDFEPSAGGDSILNSYPSPGTEGAEPTGWTMNMNRGASGPVTEIRFAVCAPK